jgi:hypothetical protein
LADDAFFSPVGLFFSPFCSVSPSFSLFLVVRRRHPSSLFRRTYPPSRNPGIDLQTAVANQPSNQPTTQPTQASYASFKAKKQKKNIHPCPVLRRNLFLASKPNHPHPLLPFL